MKTVLTTVAVALVAILGFQTHESAKAHEISVICGAAEIEEDAACVSLGPLGAVNTFGVRFWIHSFIDHGIDFPKTIQNMVRKQGRGGHWS